MEDTMFLIERSHHGDKEAREILVQEYSYSIFYCLILKILIFNF